MQPMAGENVDAVQPMADEYADAGVQPMAHENVDPVAQPMPHDTVTPVAQGGSEDDVVMDNSEKLVSAVPAKPKKRMRAAEKGKHDTATAQAATGTEEQTLEDDPMPEVVSERIASLAIGCLFIGCLMIFAWPSEFRCFVVCG